MAYKIQKKPFSDEELYEFRQSIENRLLEKYKDELETYMKKAEDLIIENNLEDSCQKLADAFPEAGIFGDILEEKNDQKKMLFYIDFPKKGVVKLVNTPDNF